MGTIFDIQRCSVNDGPGLRTVLFLKGCPLRCRWCHNPETQSGKNQLLFQEKLCIGCGACENLCPARPFSAIYVEGHSRHRTV